MEIRTVDVHDDALMRRFHQIGWRAEMEDGRSWNRFASYPELSAALRNQTPDQRTEVVGLFDGEEMVAGGVLQLPLEDNRDKAYVGVAVEPDRRRQGFGGRVLDAIVDRARDEGRALALGFTTVPFDARGTSDTHRFAAAHGFREANLEVIRLLDLPVADGLLDEIEQESAPHHADYSVETYVDTVPDALMDSYCHLFNQLALDAPTGEIDFEAEAVTPEVMRQMMARDKVAGRTVIRTFAVRDGEAVAHSDLGVPPEGAKAAQWGTLVRRDHRGHRLGAAVKVASLRRLQADHPSMTQVHTQNAEVNEQMIGINERLGFAAVALAPEFLRTL